MEQVAVRVGSYANMWSLLKRLTAPKQSGIDLTDLGGLYHDYAIFGARSKQLPGIFAANQAAKAPILRGYIQQAIAKLKASGPVSFTELFCADGYYTMVARHFGADRSIGIDNDRDGHLRNAKIIAQRLGLDHVQFIQADVTKMDGFERTDIVANLGGLYHVSDPQNVLRQSWNLAKKFLIVQTVYSLARTEPDYLEVPAPKWDWGCRFSFKWLEARIGELGGQVIDSQVNELTANPKPEDRGSAYFLVEKTTA
jgi:hypothetical protein